MTNATIIIGLLVLLTFSSVASPFGQEEGSAFFANWYELQIQMNSNDLFLSYCDDLIEDEAKRTSEKDSAFNVASPEIIQSRSDSDENANFDKNYERVIHTECSLAVIEKIKLKGNLEEMNNWGLTYFYLENTTAGIKESQYHKDIASGPFSVNMINLAMIIPFLFSAIIDTIISSRKEKIEVASNVGIGLMITGFVIMVVGLTLIGISFYQAALPFL